MLARLREGGGDELPLDIVFRATTVAELAQAVVGRSNGGSTGCLVPIRTTRDSLSMFWIHPVGGTVFCYRPLARALESRHSFYALQARGLDGLAEPFDRLEAMAAHYIEEVRTVQPQGPYLLGGWSMGGLVAFEMARQLTELNEEVLHVFMVDVLSEEAIDETDPAGWLEMVQAAGLVDDRDRQRFERVFRANWKAAKAYEPRYYSGCATLFLAEERDAFAAQRRPDRWQALVGGGMEVETVPGNHFTVVEEPQATVLASRVRTRLERFARRGAACE